MRRRNRKTGEGPFEEGTLDYATAAIIDLEDLVNELRRWRDEVDDKLENLEQRLNNAIMNATERMDMIQQRIDS